MRKKLRKRVFGGRKHKVREIAVLRKIVYKKLGLNIPKPKLARIDSRVRH